MNAEPRLRPLFKPQSIAVVGASRHPGKTGHELLAGLISSGYKGKIQPVNPVGGEILGLPVAPSVRDLPEPPELGVICLPRHMVLESALALAEAGARAVLVVSSGFRETGREGYWLERELARAMTQRDVVLLGPNCLGLINTAWNMNLCLDAEMPLPGPVAYFSQSGSLGAGLLDWARGEDVGLSTFVHLGNKAQIGESAVLEYLADDPDTRVIVGSMESLDSGPEFLRVAETATAKKPVIVLKSGNTPAGARAVSNHTGTLPGSRQASRAALHQAGVIQVDDARSLFSLAQAFARQPLPLGPNLAVITNSGGPGILAADACERSQLTLARPSQPTIERLSQLLPPYASLYNPIDIIGDASAERYHVTMQAVAEDERIHALLVILTPTGSAQIVETARATVEVAAATDKPVFACFMGGLRVEAGRRILLDAGVPCYGFPEPAIRALEIMHGYKLWKERSWPVEVCFRRDRPRAEQVIDRALDQGITELSGLRAQELAAAYELPMPPAELARTSDQAVKIAKRLGYPVALKVASPQISERAAAKGVALNLATPREVRQAFLDITSRALRTYQGTYLTGCLVQRMVAGRRFELEVGFVRDHQYGAVLRFGFAGAHAELLDDYAYRLAPLTVQDAQEMVREIKSYPLLRGVRGQDPVNLGAIEDVLLTVSQMATDFPQIQEAVFGPVLAGPEDASVIDVKLAISREHKAAGNGRQGG
ncbi:MAG: acetate--CoA ligase family protein [Desulfovibrionaceae bacterium]